MEDEPSPPKSNHKEDSNLYKAPCYDWLLIAYSPMDKSYDFFLSSPTEELIMLTAFLTTSFQQS